MGGKPVTRSRPRASFAWSVLPVVAALALGLTTLGSGLRLDDYLHGGQIRATLGGTSIAPWWDIFFLADFDPGKRFSGSMPWWTVDGLHVRFFRPVAALSHLLDHAAWPRTPWAMHAHSLAFHLIFVGLVTAAYRRYFCPKKAGVAALIFAISTNHASTVTWIANRNALLAGIFAVGTLLLYQDWCAGRRRGVLAVPCFVAALLSAEASLCIFGLLLALPLPQQNSGHGPPNRRRQVVSGAALILITVVWRLLYSHYGFGAVGSGAYVDPMRSPTLFLELLPERIASLLAMGLVPFRLLTRSDVSLLARGSLAVMFLVSAVAVLRVARAREHRFWALGGLLALLPLVASTPVERLLTIAFIGFCPAIASVILDGLRRGIWNRISGGATAITHLLVSPALFVAYALSFQPDPPLGLELQGTKSRNVVLISAPSVQDVTHLLESRFVNRLPRPAFIWYLWISESPRVRRDGCCALEIEDPSGHGREPFSEFFRDQESPLERGQTIKTLGFDVGVLEVDGTGYVTKARFDFRMPLEHPNLVFAHWTGEDFENVGVPAQ